MNKNPIPVVAAVSTLLFTASASAGDLRCASDLVEPGDSIDSLSEKCGDPDEKHDNYWIYQDADGNRYRVELSQGTVSEFNPLTD